MKQSGGDGAFWFGAGVLLGSAGAIFACAFLVLLSGAKGYCDGESLLYRFQSLIAGIMALLGAGLTVHYIGKQIRQVDRLEEDRRGRRNLADRAMLPGALSQLCGYADRSVAFLRSIPVTIKEGHYEVGLPAKPVPIIPSEVLIVFRSFIETGDGDASMSLARIMRHLQVLDARLRGLAQDEFPDNVSNVTAQPYLLAVIVDALELLTRCNNAFGFARFETESIPADITLEMLSNAVWRYFLDSDEKYNGLGATIARRCEYLAQEED